MKKAFELNINHVRSFISEDQIQKLSSSVKEKLEMVHQKSGPGSDFLGWVNLPSFITEQDFEKIEQAATGMQKKTEAVVVIGIGGSYLGAKAVIEALSHGFISRSSGRKYPEIYFAGNNISEDYLSELMDVLEGKEYGLVVISKSGTTTEPAIAFRILKDHLEKKVGKTEAGKRIIAITDAHKGALRSLADREGYETFVIPDDVGGRYSVLTPVGLVPIAIAGFNIRTLVEGAREMEEKTSAEHGLDDNPSALYAAVRYLLYRSGKKVEILVNYHHKLHFFAEWWKQLFGESEGKDGKGIFPAAVDFTTDLHSMGQYIQQGERILFETVISVKHPERTLKIPEDPANLDKLNYLAGKRIDEVNKMAELGTLLAHVDGGVPNLKISLERLDEMCLGQLVYFFEKACAVSGYLLGINPFDQPGVEAYKHNMFALLGKPGFEKETEKIRKNL
ncbi:MAG TPA: glucose-6-phosphate isomerase [Bacteroidetes bacterium]|nr:glucose-6-phosphate isomerase [Bacteroidota bacterium]